MAVLAEDSTLGRKVGPLPLYAWMGLVLLVAIVWSIWRKNKAAATTTASAASTVPDQTPPTVNQVYVYSTDFDTPPVAGRPTPPPGPSQPPPPGGPPIPIDPGHPGGGVPGPVVHSPQPVPSPAPPGQFVTIAKFTSSNPPWNSTLWGIAAKLLGNGSNWGRIWGDPRNASLVSRRKDPKLIQPGDQIWVPAK